MIPGLWRNLLEKVHFEDLERDGKIIYILEIGCEKWSWMELGQEVS
jgi:hypothetical protein